MRYLCLLGPLALALGTLVACGQEPAPPPLPAAVSVARQPVVGGVVDDSTTGVVGLAISAVGHVFLGHCSGTLIAPNLVLTARHCVSLTEATPQERVECGVSQFAASGPGPGDLFLASPDTVRPLTPTAPTFFRGLSVRVPDKAVDFCGFDIALLTLAQNIPPELAKPITPRLDSTPAINDNFAAEGFGLTDPDSSDTDGTRMRLDGRHVACAGAACNAPNQIQSDEWLSLDSKICPGDSGGPALDDKGQVMGVASRGADGCSNAIYGDVASWKDLIIETARSAAATGGYEVPSWASEGADSGGASTPLGQLCEASCRDGYACYSENGVPPGRCVPRCNANALDCPGGYTCSASIGACVPNSPPPESKGCSVSPGTKSSSASVSAALLALTLLRSRRRRRSH